MPANMTPPVNCQYGAPMGRRSSDPAPQRLYLQRVRLDSGGYDPGGAYWGVGAPLWAWSTADGVRSGYLRARDRDHAKACIWADEPGATFYR